MKNVLCLVMLISLVSNVFGQGKGATQLQVDEAKSVMVSQHTSMVSALSTYYLAHTEAGTAASHADATIATMRMENPGWDGSSYQNMAANFVSNISRAYTCYDDYIMTKDSRWDNKFSIIRDSYILHCYYNTLDPANCNWDALVQEFNIVNGQESTEPTLRTSICTNAAESTSKMFNQTLLLKGFTDWMIDEELAAGTNLESAQINLYTYLHP